MGIEIIAAIVGVALGAGGTFVYGKQRASKSKHDADKIVARAETKGK